MLYAAYWLEGGANLPPTTSGLVHVWTDSLDDASHHRRSPHRLRRSSLPTTIDNLELRGHLARSLLEPLGCFHPIMVRFPHRTTTHFHGRCELRLTTTRRVDSDGGSRVNVLVVKASCRTSIAGRRRTVLRRASSKIGVRLHNFFAVARRRCGCGGIQHGCSSRMLPTNPSTIR